MIPKNKLEDEDRKRDLEEAFESILKNFPDLKKIQSQSGTPKQFKRTKVAKRAIELALDLIKTKLDEKTEKT